MKDRFLIVFVERFVIHAVVWEYSNKNIQFSMAARNFIEEYKSANGLGPDTIHTLRPLGNLSLYTEKAKNALEDKYVVRFLGD